MALQDDDDLRLIRASASLLQDLEQSLPHLLWKVKGHRRVHQLVRLRDLDYVLQLVEPFQPEPQLLDTRLKALLPPIVSAYLEYLQLPQRKPAPADTVSLDVAVSKILYTFCKVRGEKVITAFLNNEPRYLELVLSTLESCCEGENDNHQVPWERSYILLLWLSHLLLAPFDLASISGPSKPSKASLHLPLASDVPSIASRVMAVSLRFIQSATKEQDAASKLLVRLVLRPDMQRLRLPTALVSWALESIGSVVHHSSATLHSFLGPFRFLAAMTVSPDSEETSSLIPGIHAATTKLVDNVMFTSVTSSAVTKKLLIKMSRNIALLNLQCTSVSLTRFFETVSVLEDTIDYLLQSLGDRDTPVRFAASKALSMIILRLDPELSHEVVQAILDSMKEDMPRSFADTDFSTVDALRWHGLTLTLAHALFRKSASPAQLPDIVNALLLALTFEQRGTTGSSIGSNVRDAACFGIWSMSRRYSTAELLSVDVADLRTEEGISQTGISAIQIVALHLLLSACLDPAGNIRRGSSAALQELIGRHPDQVSNGISLVQVVDYHAVGLRQRAAIDVAHGASQLDMLYCRALLMALLKWRGIGSPDVSSREIAATSIGRLCSGQSKPTLEPALNHIFSQLAMPGTDVEYHHGSLIALSCILDEKMSGGITRLDLDVDILSYPACVWWVFDQHCPLYTAYTPRSLRADLFSAIARVVTSVANLSSYLETEQFPRPAVMENVTTIVAGLVSRSEDSILQALPNLVRALISLHESGKSARPILDVSGYLTRVRTDASSTIHQGAGRAIALASAFPWLESIYDLSHQETITAFGEIIETARTTEWRVVGLRALLLVVESGPLESSMIDRLGQPLHAGLNDYTITERGDVGSLVRAAAIVCTSKAWKLGLMSDMSAANDLLLKDVRRLSLEKLDRTRIQAARCLRWKDTSRDGEDITDVSSVDYFRASFRPLQDAAWPVSQREAILEGSASCAGAGGEALLQSARVALAEIIHDSDGEARLALMNSLAALLKRLIVAGSDSQSLLELLGFLLDAVPSLQSMQEFSWRNLLVLVQKSHFKSKNIAKILAAVQVYRSLAASPVIQSEVLKKLSSMLRTHPYPRIRIDVAECLFLVTGDVKLKPVDWGRPGQRYT